MPVSISRYVDITSGIGAASNVAQRNLGGLIISSNLLIPSGRFLTFESAADVGAYFGTASEEYLRAVFYFGWVSKNITSPQTLSFWFWNNDTAEGSRIYGVKNTGYAIGQFTGINNGDFTLTMGGFTGHVTAIDLSAAGSLAAVAADMQDAIRAKAGAPAAWTGATVTYDAANARFDLVSGATGTDTISVIAGVTHDVAAPLGWLTGATLSNGTAAQLIADNLNALIQVTNNFGSFLFADALAISLANVEAAASWNNSLDPNIQFMYTQRTTAANASAWSAALLSTGGITLTLESPVANEYPEMAPMMILAATDYTRPNSVQNYMFQIFNLTPSVTTDAGANTYDALLVNYYGQTQTAGQLLEFYQRGVMMGLPVDPSDQNVYANEIWFKDAIGAQLMTLLLALSQVPANNAGRAMLLVTIQNVILIAINNGTISAGKALSNTQKLYISQVTGDPNAWQQVQTIGYWVNVVIQAFVVDSVTQFKAIYTLVYSKDDTIRLIEGSDILI